MWVLGTVLHVHMYIQYVVDDLVQYDKLEFPIYCFPDQILKHVDYSASVDFSDYFVIAAGAVAGCYSLDHFKFALYMSCMRIPVRCTVL